MIPSLLVFAGVILLAYLLLWPVPIDPAAWSPPEPPGLPAAVRAENQIPVERITLGGARGPEDVAADRRGRLYTGTRDGAIRRVDPSTGDMTVLARTGGRPLGLAFGEDGTLYICDVRRGLLSLSPDGRLRERVTEVAGVTVTRANGLAVASDGTVFFTDSSTRWPESTGAADLLEHRPHGRLLAFDPRRDHSRVVAESLFFPNGVALSRDESSVLVVETSRYRISRVRVSGGDGRGPEVFADNLPGFPDGVSRDGEHFWVGLVAPRNRLFDRALLPRPALRKVLYRLPGLPPVGRARPGAVLALDGSGRCIWHLPAESSGFASVTNVRPSGHHLCLGSADEDAVGRIPRPDLEVGSGGPAAGGSPGRREPLSQAPA